MRTKFRTSANYYVIPQHRKDEELLKRRNIVLDDDDLTVQGGIEKVSLDNIVTVSWPRIWSEGCSRAFW